MMCQSTAGETKKGYDNAPNTKRKRGASADLVVGNVLVHAWVDDICHVDGLDVLEEDKGPHGDDGNGQTIADIQHRFIS